MRLFFIFSCAFVLASCGDGVIPIAPEAGTPSLLTTDAVRDRYIVVFRPSVADPRGLARSLVRAHGGRVHLTYEHALKGFAATLPAAALNGIQRNPNVAFIEPDAMISLESSSVALPITQPNATWGIDRIDQRALPLSSTYTYDATGAGVHVYIFDTGIRFTHSEFEGRAIRGIDVFAGDPARFTDGNDCHGHGTHVAGTAGGRVFGVAKAVTLVSVRVFDCGGGGTNSLLIGAVDWLTANHVKPAVANMSLTSVSAALDSAVAHSITTGITYVVAAGNTVTGGGDGDACTRSPSRVPAAITIALTDDTDSRTWGNYGPCVDWFAPGLNIRAAGIANDNAQSVRSGTSMSTPHVSGVAALYLQHHPQASPQQVTQALDAALTRGVVGNAGSGTVNNHLLYSRGAWLPNQLPTASISAPLDGASAILGDPVQFAGSATDAEDGTLGGAALRWTSSLDGEIGSGTSFTRSDLSAGLHTITLTATDGQGGAGSASVSVTIAANQPPAATILSPANGQSFTVGTAVTFQGSGSDAEDGNIPGTELGWTSDIQGALGSGATLTTSSLTTGLHTITLTATDSRGATGQTSIAIRITANQPPVAAFSVSCSNNPTCQFSDRSTDSDGVITSWSWSFGVAGATSTARHPTYTYSAPGTYVVQLTVRDNGGATHSTSRVVGCVVHKNGKLRCS